MKLYSFGSAWSLASFDPDSLAVQVFLHVSSEVDYEIYDLRESGLFSQGDYPVLEAKSIIRGFSDIVSYLKKNGHDLDAELTPVQKSQSEAFISLARQVLYDALLLVGIMNDENARKLQRVYAGGLRPVDSFKYNQRGTVVEWATERLGTRYGPSLKIDQAKIRQVYRAFSVLVGEKKFCFRNEKPSTLDCVLYAYLATHLNNDFNNNPLKTILRHEFPGLVRFVEGFQREFISGSHLRWSESIFSKFGKPEPINKQILAKLSRIPQSFREYINCWKEYLSTSDEAPMDEGTRLALQEKRRTEFYNYVTIGLSSCLFVAYVLMRGLVKIQVIE